MISAAVQFFFQVTRNLALVGVIGTRGTREPAWGNVRQRGKSTTEQ